MKLIKKMGAGILPLVSYKGTMLFLLGKEQNSNLWSDFGGTSLKNEKIFDTAIREGYEETDGLLGDEYNLRLKVKNNFVKYLSTTNNRYNTIIFNLNYTDANYFKLYFNHHRKFLEDNNLLSNLEGFNEKSKIDFFSKNDLIIHRKKIRPFYTEITDQLINL